MQGFSCFANLLRAGSSSLGSSSPTAEFCIRVSLGGSDLLAGAAG